MAFDAVNAVRSAIPKGFEFLEIEKIKSVENKCILTILKI